jgi:hypothetical protein
MQYWITCNDESSSFKQAFAPLAAQLGKKLSLEVNYLYLDGVEYGCDGGQDFPCSNQCVNYGRYCAEDPDGDLEQGISGGQVVAENLRQQKLYELLAPNNLESWWSYINLFLKNCNSPNLFNKDCAEEQLKGLNIDVNALNSKIEACGKLVIDPSSVDTLPACTNPKGCDPGTNSCIEDMIAKSLDQGIRTLPSLFINTFEVDDLDCIGTSVDSCTVLKEICSDYTSGNIPSVCTCSGMYISSVS